jgi:N-acyl-D-amino-acid deacylase
MRSLWGHGDSLVRILDAARKSGVDITADVYPYLYWHSTLTVLFPKRDFENRSAAEFALTQTSTPTGLLLGRWSRTRRTPARRSPRSRRCAAPTRSRRSSTSFEIRSDAQSTGHSTESVIGTSMVEPDVEQIMKWPHTNLSTDGRSTGRTHGVWGLPRFLGRRAERKVMSLEEAVHRMTSLAADHMASRIVAA